MTEQRFKQFKQSISNDEFNDIEFLKSNAQLLDENDKALSKRILQRVENLQKSEKIPTEAPAATMKARFEEVILKIPPTQETAQEALLQLKQKPFLSWVIIPFFIFAFYQIIWASERFESQAQVIVQQPDGMATMDSSMALLTGLGASSNTVSDTELVKAYIYSNDMLNYLDTTLALKEHYRQTHIDYFSRMHDDDTQEDFLEFYIDHVEVIIDSNSNIIQIYSQGFDENFAQQLTETIVKRAEWYINSIGHQLAEAQLTFIKGEHRLVEKKLESAQKNLLRFQQRYNLLDPTAEGIAMQQITYTLEGQISSKEAELKTLKAVMSDWAPQVASVKNQLSALKAQLINERNKLSLESKEAISVSEILAGYTDLKIKMELALQAYTSSQISLEKSRIEAYRQLKFLITVESATQPEKSKYPDSFYNIALFILLSSLAFAIGRIIILTAKELK